MKKVKVVDNEVVITDERGSYILDKKEYKMSYVEALEKLGDKMPVISQLLFLQENIEDVNKALLQVGGDLIDEDEFYLSREQYSAVDAWYVYMGSGYVNSNTRTGASSVRAVSPFNKIKNEKLIKNMSFQTFSMLLVTLMELTAVLCGALHHIILLIGIIALLAVSIIDDREKRNEK